MNSNQNATLSVHEKDLLSLFKNFLERNNLPKLILIANMNTYYSNTVPMEQSEVEKALKEFLLYDKSFNPLFKTNPSLVNELLFFYEHYAIVYYYKTDFGGCYDLLNHSAKYLDKFCPEKNLKPSKLKNTYNKVECLQFKLRMDPKAIEDIKVCKKFLDEYNYATITENLEKLIYCYYQAFTCYLLNSTNEIAQHIKKFYFELESYNKENPNIDKKIADIQSYLDLKVRLLGIKIYEKRPSVPYKEVLATCEAIRNKYRETNHDFFIKLSIKIADLYYQISDFFLSNRTIAFLNNFLNDLILYPKISKIRFKVLTYAKFLAASLVVGDYFNFEEILKKVTTNFERMKKFNIQASKRSLSLIEMSFLNNIALHKYYIKYPVIEAEKTLILAKEINSNGNNIDPNTNFAIDNNLACFNLLKGNYDTALKILKSYYIELSKNQSSEKYFYILNNLTLCTKLMIDKNIYIPTQDDSQFVIDKFKEVANFFFSKNSFEIKTLGELKYLVIVYNYIYLSITSNNFTLTQINFDILEDIIRAINFAWAIQGEGEAKLNIWKSSPDLILKLLHLHGLMLFYKGDYFGALKALAKLDDLAKVIDLNTDYNIEHYVKIIKLRADILFRLKNFDECTNEYYIVLMIYKRLNLNESEKKAVVLCNLAQCHVFLNRFQAAKNHLIEAEMLFNRNSGENKAKLEKVREMLSVLA